MNKDILKQYAWLFRVNLIVSAFTFGGGYVVVPMLKKHFVTNRHVLSEEELFDIAAIAQSSPGAIAINLSASHRIPDSQIKGSRHKLYRGHPAAADPALHHFRWISVFQEQSYRIRRSPWHAGRSRGTDRRLYH